ncbi:MAG TPA: hypothetical protein VGD62_05930 [Acidobacteriaceae bacterium]
MPARAARRSLAGASAAALLLVPALSTRPAAAQQEGTAVVTALPKSGEVPTIPQQSIQVTVDGKQVQPTVWRPYGHDPVELVLLIDSSARSSFGRNLEDLTKFIGSLPPNVSVGIAYMQNGNAIFTGPISKEHATVASQLHLPAGTPGSNASPYFCLSDLAKRWPSPRSAARREVIMITDGVDEYQRRYDPDDPYLAAAVADSQRAGLVVYSIYYRDQGRASGSGYETNAGQNYLNQVADETGGRLYYEGLSNPVSFTPFFDDLSRRLNNQYELGFPARAEKKESYPQLKIKSQIGSVKFDAPKHVAVGPEGK